MGAVRGAEAARAGPRSHDVMKRGTETIAAIVGWADNAAGPATNACRRRLGSVNHSDVAWRVGIKGRLSQAQACGGRAGGLCQKARGRGWGPDMRVLLI